MLEVRGPGLGRGSLLQRADTSDRPIRDPEWRIYELTAAVPEEAQSIEYGLALTGEGEAAIDSVAVEAVSPIND